MSFSEDNDYENWNQKCRHQMRLLGSKYAKSLQPSPKPASWILGPPATGGKGTGGEGRAGEVKNC